MSTSCPLPVCPQPICPEPTCQDPICPEPTCQDPICLEPKCPVLSDYVSETITTPKKILFISAIPNNTFVDLSWNAPHNGGIDISNYLIQYKKSTDLSNWTDLLSNITSIKVSGLTNNIEYNFRVQAKNLKGFGPVSEIINVKPILFNIILYIKFIVGFFLLIILILVIMSIFNNK